MKKDLGQLLLESGQITAEELHRATAEAEKAAEPVGRACLRLGLVNEGTLKTVLELHYGLNYVNLSKVKPDSELVGLLPQELVLQEKLIPVSKEGNRLTLAMVTPSDKQALDKAKKHLADWQIRPVVCSDDSFEDFAQRTFLLAENATQNPPEQMSILESVSMTESTMISIENGSDSVQEDRAIVLLSNHILSNAMTRGCTNIHIEPGERQILVHYRKEGILFAARKLPKSILPELVKRFKSMSAANEAAALPYDGRLNVRQGEQNFFFRLSIVPSIHGEHLVIWLE